MKLTSKFGRKAKAAALVCIASGAVVLSFGSASAAELKDIEASSEYAKSSIISLWEKNLLTGDSDGMFNPNQAATRAEMAVLMVKALSLDTSNLPDVPTFNDVPKDHWAFKYVEAAYRSGLVKGMSNGAFGVDNPCTREQMAVMLVRSLGLTDGILESAQELTNVSMLSDRNQISDWAVNSVEFSYEGNLLKGYGNAFNPGEYARKEQLAVLVDRFLSNRESIEGMSAAITEKAKSLKFPSLYKALQNSVNFKGRAQYSLQATLTNTALDEYIQVGTDIQSIVNGNNTSSKVKMTIGGNILEQDVLEYEVIVIGEDAYLRYSGENTWMLLSLSQLRDEGILFQDGEKDKSDTLELMDSYLELPVVKGNTSEIEGIPVTKYTIQLDKALAASILPEEYLDTFPGLDESYGGAFDISMEIYVNSSDQLVKQVITVNSAIDIEGEEIQIEILFDGGYTDIGQDIEILAPPESEVETGANV